MEWKYYRDKLMGHVFKTTAKIITGRWVEISKAEYDDCVAQLEGEKLMGIGKIQLKLEKDMLTWLKTVRAGKYTSLIMMIRTFYMRSFFQPAWRRLKDSGKIRKTKSGYRAN